MNQGVYKIVNTANDHFYIGSTVNLRRRRVRHFSELRTGNHKNRRLQAAWDKYGAANFQFVVLELVVDCEHLHVAEDRWMGDHIGKRYCYNLGAAARSPMLGKVGPLSPTYGYQHTDAAKAKISAAGKGRTVPPEVAIARGVARRGTPVTAEQRAKISSALRGEGNFWFGKKRPDHGPKIRKAVAVTRDDGTTTVYSSITELRAALRITPPTVHRALSSGRAPTKGKFAGWVFRYA